MYLDAKEEKHSYGWANLPLSTLQVNTSMKKFKSFDYFYKNSGLLSWVSIPDHSINKDNLEKPIKNSRVQGESSRNGKESLS